MASRGSFLQAGQSLGGGDYLASPNGQYCAVMQDDGNFVVYWGCLPDRLIGAIWASDTGGLGSQSLSMQHDGNLVLYRDGKAQWASNTTGKSGNLFARLADDGNFLLYQGTPDQPGTAYWDTSSGQLTFWIKNKGGYVAKAWLKDGAGETGAFDNPQCKTLTSHVSRTATLSFGESGLSGNSFKDIELGALRCKRFLMTGSAFSPDAEPQTGHGTF